MRIFIGICHPKDVHFWKHVIHNLEKDGHEVRILAWDKDVTLYLLDTYGFDYEVIGKSYKNFLMKFYDMLRSDVKVLKAAMKFKPDLFIHGDPYLAHVSTITGKYHIEYCDTDHAKLIHLTTFPFSDVICTPASFNKEVDPKKHLTFNGYSELAYLHPAYFKPNPSVLDELGLKMGERFIVMRFVAWGASHDVNQQGFNSKEEIVEGLEKYGRVFIVSEKELDESLEKYRISIPAQKVHDLLYYATLYIGEGATMASEAAILGTPSIYINTLRLGYTDEEENEYGLLYN
ncbi:MAG: DUF354 domain-containing protein, partial [Desulfobacterales bacterium]|nr:DUF354 domain-containing protein [Desulfobacterales bacterium]